MKKLIIPMIAGVLLFTGCTKSEPDLLFGTTPQERVHKDLADLKQQLVSPADGWIVGMGTSAKGGYGFYMKFADNDMVTMMSDYNASSANTIKESTYRLKWLMKGTLIFDTYNYISLMQDPLPSVAGGGAGTGYKSDVEFEYLRTSGDSLLFTGKKYRNLLVLKKATSAQSAAYSAKGYAAAVTKNINFFTLNPFSTITVNNKVCEFNFDFGGKAGRFTVANGDGTFAITSKSIYHTINGIGIIGGTIINGVTINAFVWKDANTLVAIDNEGKEYPVKVNQTSIIPYLNALGVTFKNILTPNATTFSGWSTDFADRRAAVKTNVARWNIGGNALTVTTINFGFDIVNKRMTVVFNVTYGSSTTTLTYPYTYVQENGVFKFNISVPSSGNESLIYGDLAKLLQERINVDKFKLDYFVNPTNGSVMSQFTSVDHPDFYFTGNNQ